MPVDPSYPINVVSDAQLVKDYLSIKPLYTFEDILALYKYWDEVQLAIFKLKIQQEYESKPSYLKTPKNYKVPKVKKKQVEEALKKTALEKEKAAAEAAEAEETKEAPEEPKEEQPAETNDAEL